MVKKPKSFSLKFVQVEDRSEEIARTLAKQSIEKVLAKHGAVSYNLDEVLYKYISGDMCNGHKKG